MSARRIAYLDILLVRLARTLVDQHSDREMRNSPSLNAAAATRQISHVPTLVLNSSAALMTI
jgi:hypothetical protein